MGAEACGAARLLDPETEQAEGPADPRGCPPPPTHAPHRGLPPACSPAWASVSAWKLGEGRLSVYSRLLESQEQSVRFKEVPGSPGLTRPPQCQPGAGPCRRGTRDRREQGSCGRPPLPPRARPRLPRLPPPLRRARLFGEESGPICFHSESLKIPFWRNERRKARVPRPARWVPARARRRAGWGRRPSPSSARPGRPGSEGGGLGALICMKRTLAAHLQRRN
uniref:Uncharacterized protein n=1 Tax=Rangifer tarandus platyrhynchus TaxID=3082113 RepID=A0ACB0EY78_RANTA|nr:unnamed protein product [Rangifer tarandus platyrhynchus]